MKVLVIGSGGREHALCWKLAQSPKLDRLYCAPGNAGIASVAECLPLAIDDFEGLLDFARGEKLDLTVVGPEAPLVAGLTDLFQQHGLSVFGPSKHAAQLEGSKAFAKSFMRKYHIPSAAFSVFESYKDAARALKDASFPIVIKASGLAAGKGVIICPNREEANETLQDILLDHRFGEAGSTVVIEEYLEGEEATILALTDGQDYVLFPASQDHKRLLDGDQGPNTGGMGAYAPAPLVTSEMLRRVEAEILIPTLKGMSQEGHPFVGCLYIGIIKTPQGIKVLEYNCRFGDPEAQVIVPLFEGDLLDAFLRALEGKLHSLTPTLYPSSAVCVVLASGGYPAHYEIGKVIEGLDQIHDEEVMIFHAGTRRQEDQILTDGGRVLGVTARAPTLPEALTKAYQAAARIHFEGMNYRRDIAQRGMGNA